MARRYIVCVIDAWTFGISVIDKEKIMAHEKFQSCIDACVRCAELCEHCAAACLGEENVKEMAECIRLDSDCAEACWGAASFMSRGSQFAHDICRICAEICEACGSECDRHSQMEHCRQCAKACHECAEECRKMAGVTV